MKVLLIDSDRDWVDMLTGCLKAHGYDVSRAYTREQAKGAWMEHRPDLVLMDPVLKGSDMLPLYRELRLQHDALMLVMAGKRDVQEEIRCLEAGVDDYLQKPFFPAQLFAHLHAISRRIRSTVELRPAAVITVGPLCLDSRCHEVMVSGKTMRLTPIESKLLYLLAVNANTVCTTDQMVTYVWGYSGEGDASVIKTHIRHLRQKIEPEPSHPRYIVTVPRVGYTLSHPIAEVLDVPAFQEGTRPLRVVSR